jgi:hypothetical protein
MTKLSDKIIDGIDSRINKALPQSPEATRRRRDRILRPVGIAALIAGGVTFGVVAYNAFEHWNSTPPPSPSFDEDYNHDRIQQDIDSGVIHIDVTDSDEAK